MSASRFRVVVGGASIVVATILFAAVFRYLAAAGFSIAFSASR